MPLKVTQSSVPCIHLDRVEDASEIHTDLYLLGPAEASEVQEGHTVVHLLDRAADPSEATSCVGSSYSFPFMMEGEAVLISP